MTIETLPAVIRRAATATPAAAPAPRHAVHTVSKGDTSLSKVLGVFAAANAVAGAAGYALMQITT
ncbi:hypothetical protein [Micromonospora sp. NPDC005174]|uniref:hypothetical protein n=1 Tax=Micromonospora sp. NPDC005174 TaxID=3157018 RepID=UPI0033A7CDDB